MFQQMIPMSWCTVVLLLVIWPGNSASKIGVNTSLDHHRAVADVNLCASSLGLGLYAKRVKICADCKELFGHDELREFCHKDCFSTAYFEGCATALYPSSSPSTPPPVNRNFFTWFNKSATQV